MQMRSLVVGGAFQVMCLSSKKSLQGFMVQETCDYELNWSLVTVHLSSFIEDAR